MRQDPATSLFPVLALDTAGAGLGLALCLDAKTADRKNFAMGRGQAEVLFPAAQDLLAAAGLAWPDLRALAVATGPGSFTGLRLGLAAGEGLALALSIPLLGVTVFDAYAAQATTLNTPGAQALLIAVESKRAELFVDWRAASKPYLEQDSRGRQVHPDALAAYIGDQAGKGQAPFALIGDAATRAQAALQQGGLVAETVHQGGLDPAVLGWTALRLLEIAPARLSTRPLYLRGADVTLPKTS